MERRFLCENGVCIELPDCGCKDLNSTQFSYKLAGGAGSYGIDAVMGDQLDLNESEMSVVVPFADGHRRDGVGDLLEVSGIDTERHRLNPIVLFDHGKGESDFATWPIALGEDPTSRQYTVNVDQQQQIATVKAYFYRGTGIKGLDGDKEKDFAVYCAQIFDLIARRYIRGGSIGYQAIKAIPLEADYTLGTPQGLWLQKVRMLEASVVILPANMDTVRSKSLNGDFDFIREIISMPKICGKPPSQYLVKSLSTYAPEKKAQMGYEGKASVGPKSSYKVVQGKDGWYVVEDPNRTDLEEGPFNTQSDAQLWLDEQFTTYKPAKALSAFSEGSGGALVKPAEQSKAKDGKEKKCPACGQLNTPDKNGQYFCTCGENYMGKKAMPNSSASPTESDKVPLDKLPDTKIPPAEWKPGAGAIKGFYVKRTRLKDTSQDSAMFGGDKTNTIAYSRTFGTEREAQKEADAWNNTDGEWKAEVLQGVAPRGKSFHPEEDTYQSLETADSPMKSLRLKYRKKSQPSDDISPEKARQVLKDGEVRGHKLTPAQEGMFGAAAGRDKNIKYLRIKYKALKTADILKAAARQAIASGYNTIWLTNDERDTKPLSEFGAGKWDWQSAEVQGDKLVAIDPEGTKFTWKLSKSLLYSADEVINTARKESQADGKIRYVYGGSSDWDIATEPPTQWATGTAYYVVRPSGQVSEVSGKGFKAVKIGDLVRKVGETVKEVIKDNNTILSEMFNFRKDGKKGFLKDTARKVGHAISEAVNDAARDDDLDYSKERGGSYANEETIDYSKDDEKKLPRQKVKSSTYEDSGPGRIRNSDPSYETGHKPYGSRMSPKDAEAFIEAFDKLSIRPEAQHRIATEGASIDKNLKALHPLRMKYRNVKNCRRRVKGGRPGSSMLYVHGKDLEAVRKAAQDAGLTLSHRGEVGKSLVKVQLQGSDDSIDQVAKMYGRRRNKGLGFDITIKVSNPGFVLQKAELSGIDAKLGPGETDVTLSGIDEMEIGRFLRQHRILPSADIQQLFGGTVGTRQKSMNVNRMKSLRLKYRTVTQ